MISKLFFFQRTNTIKHTLFQSNLKNCCTILKNKVPFTNKRYGFNKSITFIIIFFVFVFNDSNSGSQLFQLHPYPLPYFSHNTYIKSFLLKEINYKLKALNFCINLVKELYVLCFVIYIIIIFSSLTMQN